jgi:hypothetical protein
VKPTPAPTHFSKSATLISSGTLSATTEACCFVVLDTIYEAWWQEISIYTYYTVVNLTSITTLITPYPTATSTNYETNVYTTNATSYLDVEIGYDPVALYTNVAPGPKENSIVLNANGKNVTAVTTAGKTVYSPQAFWVYSTVRIITAEAVTDSSGNKVCGTTSACESAFPINSDSMLSSISSIYPSVISILESTATSTNELVFTGINSNVDSYFFTNQTATQTGVIISLTTPFVYAPTRDAKAVVDGMSRICTQGPGLENYGYPVQTLLDYLVKNPAYSSQYPGLANCLPGGPAIVPIQNCSMVSPFAANAPATVKAGGDLTSSTVITVTPTGVTAQPESVGPLTRALLTQAAASSSTSTLRPSSFLNAKTSSTLHPNSKEVPNISNVGNGQPTNTAVLTKPVIIGTIASLTISAIAGVSSVTVGSQIAIIGGPELTLDSHFVVTAAPQALVVYMPASGVSSLAWPTIGIMGEQPYKTLQTPAGMAGIIWSMMGFSPYAETTLIISATSTMSSSSSSSLSKTSRTTPSKPAVPISNTLLSSLPTQTSTNIGLSAIHKPSSTSNITLTSPMTSAAQSDQSNLALTKSGSEPRRFTLGILAIVWVVSSISSLVINT